MFFKIAQFDLRNLAEPLHFYFKFILSHFRLLKHRKNKVHFALCKSSVWMQYSLRFSPRSNLPYLMRRRSRRDRPTLGIKYSSENLILQPHTLRKNPSKYLIYQFLHLLTTPPKPLCVFPMAPRNETKWQGRARVNPVTARNSVPGDLGNPQCWFVGY